jgi:hypothetical protein
MVVFAHEVGCRCQVRPSEESRKTAEPSMRIPAAANRVPVQTTE